jgi:hypothetical protein
VLRSKEWNYRRATYQRMAERLGGAALAAHDEMYRGQEAAAV